MTKDDADRFSEFLAEALGFWGQVPSKFAISVWWQACQRFELRDVVSAVGRHAMDPDRGMFAPKPADIVRHIQGTPTDRATRAWGIALDAAARVGGYTDVVFDDPIVHAVIADLGGWPAFCRHETDKLSYLQHRFSEAYRSYSGRSESLTYPPKLAGDRSPDEMYHKRGIPPPKPVLIGDPERARRVIAGGTSGGNRMTLAVDIAGLTAITDQRLREAS